MTDHPDFSIETCLNTRFDYDNPEFDIRDIAYALAMLPRYTGRTRNFRRMSIAEHSWLVSYLSEDPFEGLMHDTTEAFLNDMNSPLKKRLPDYQRVEREMYVKLARHFGFPEETSQATKKADMEALILEADELMLSKGKDWRAYPKYAYILRLKDSFPFPLVQALEPEQAYLRFMERFNTLNQLRNPAWTLIDATIYKSAPRLN